jgi:urocanate hydratase
VKDIANEAMTIKLDYELPEYPKMESCYRRAPRRESHLTQADKLLAIKNALRYIHPDHHAQMAKEFAQELEEHGRIYGYRFRPEGKIYGKPISEYKGKCIEGRAIQVMIDNNLDFDVALYPYELVTYGETGQVCQNWMQYRLIKKYLEELTDEQTLVVMSGHPLGLFHSHKLAPRVIITNGLMVGTFDDQENFNRAAALGVANYGQMTAGGWMYIGPQGIVHGTFNTLLNAGRLKLGIPNDKDLAGKLFVSAGLGGMSGAQGKAAEIAGAASIIAEVDDSRIDTRYTQGWVSHRTSSLEEAVKIALDHQKDGKACAVAYHGNIVDLLEYLYEKNVHVDLMSDQTSCHVPYDGGYCPQGLTFAQRTEMLDKDPEGFRKLVDKTLQHHYEMICKFHERGTFLRLWQQLPQGGLRYRREEHLQERRERPRRLHLPVLCRGHSGALPVRLRLRPVPLVLPQPRSRGPAQDRHGCRRVHQGAQPPLSGLRQLRLGPRRGEEQARRRHAVPHPLSRCDGPHEHRAEVQRDGQKRRDRAGHPRPRPSRHRRHRRAVP